MFLYAPTRFGSAIFPPGKEADRPHLHVEYQNRHDDPRLRVARQGNCVGRALEQLVYPFKDDVEDMQAGLIENMLNGNPQQRGDGAFSMYALDTLVTHHLAEVKPIAGGLYAQLSNDRFFGKVIGRYRQQQVWVMDFHDVHIILLEKRRKLQLLFWENLNNLLNPAFR